jgi:hypothetical protein
MRSREDKILGRSRWGRMHSLPYADEFRNRLLEYLRTQPQCSGKLQQLGAVGGLGGTVMSYKRHSLPAWALIPTSRQSCQSCQETCHPILEESPFRLPWLAFCFNLNLRLLIKTQSHDLHTLSQHPYIRCHKPTQNVHSSNSDCLSLASRCSIGWRKYVDFAHSPLLVPGR